MSMAGTGATGATATIDARSEMLRITDLHAFYDESHILHGIDLTVREG